MSTSSAGHWDEVYRTKAADELSWAQRSPETSLRLVQWPGTERGSLVDIGAGTSTLVDEALAAGFTRVTVLDLSAEALGVVQDRLAARSAQVEFVVEDVLEWRPTTTYDVWHDRAVFHFLTEETDQRAYADLAAAAVRPGGIAVIGAFAEDGPDQCSGLPTSRWSAEALGHHFEPDFDLAHTEREVHTTPWGSAQAFTWVVLRRR